MNRRSFLGKTFGAVAAACVAPFLPKSPALKPLGLAFHKDAFAMVSPELGISIRFIKQYDIIADKHPSRFDVRMVDSRNGG